MGLLFQMPVTENEGDRTVQTNGGLLLKSYGLPFIFWGYLMAILSVILIMFVAIKAPMLKMMESSDSLNLFLAWLVMATLVLIPVVLLTYFFYEKRIFKKDDELHVIHTLFFIPIWRRKYLLESPESFIVEHFLDSPNMARLHNQEGMEAFKNRGHYHLIIKLKNGRLKSIDRHSRPTELKKMIETLSRF